MPQVLDVDLGTFDPILPSPVRDIFTFNFERKIVDNPNPDASDPPSISAVAWTVALVPDSRVTDPDPQSRLLDTPTFSTYKTAALIGDMIDGCEYIVTAVVTLGAEDGRILEKRASLSCLSEPFVDRLDLLPGAVPFDYRIWITTFPEFDGVNSETALSFYNQASLIFRNDGTSLVQDVATRRTLLNMLTAHIAATFGGPGGAAGLVGRINSKSVNGVSVSAEGFGVTGTQAWYLTTRYGAAFWRATAAYRTFRYIPGPSRFGPGVGSSRGFPQPYLPYYWN